MPTRCVRKLEFIRVLFKCFINLILFHSLIASLSNPSSTLLYATQNTRTLTYTYTHAFIFNDIFNTCMLRLYGVYINMYKPGINVFGINVHSYDFLSLVCFCCGTSVTYSENFVHYIPTLIGNYVVTQFKQQIHFYICVCLYILCERKPKQNTLKRKYRLKMVEFYFSLYKLRRYGFVGILFVCRSVYVYVVYSFIHTHVD